MKFNRIAVVIVLIAVVVVAGSAIFYFNSQDHGPSYPDSNENVVSMKDFDVTDTYTGTNANGSIIVQKFDDTIRVTVLSNFSISENDFGGVAFYCDNNFDPVTALCSYQDDLFASSTGIQKTLLHDDFGGCISVGLALHTGGGTGYIEAVFESVWPDISQIDEIEILIAVGSNEESSSVGTTSETISLEIT